MTNELKKTLTQTLAPTHRINLQNRMLARIQSGELVIAPRRSLQFLRGMLWALQGIMILLNVGAVSAVVRAVQAQGTFVFLREFTTALSDYRDLAWRAFIESVPLTSLLLLVAALVGLILSLVMPRYLAKENLIA